MSVSVNFGRCLLEGGQERRQPPLAVRLIRSGGLDGVAHGYELPVQSGRQRARQVQFSQPPVRFG